jgi:hypothetical protein
VWQVDPSLGIDREISICTTAITRQQPVNSNRGTVSSVRSVLSCYTQDKLGVVSQSINQSDDCWVSVFVSCYCEKLVAVAGDNSGTQRKQNVHC